MHTSLDASCLMAIFIDLLEHIEEFTFAIVFHWQITWYLLYVPIHPLELAIIYLGSLIFVLDRKI